ncbi:putative conjugative DNA transfer protein [Agrobacterium tumefaciens str. Kerr 14]|uniref:Putative conjugative DNA transfer protein n=1 Tax=Agrobacterium tumefaciens str. Kerr 14 TaxID=1183424 RepID=A0A1S7SBV4_AGRTU|nr:TrbG/VirB9 family P-type conjugative transfer protein [Agrobacterium tumefaciens]CUX65881.1 putative conjugative DNA transfer protein [Agrobacterium tumefaciens str. Kerr 14]
MMFSTTIKRDRMMLKRISTTMIAATMAVVPALADQVPPAKERQVVPDSRIRYLGYGPNSVYRLDINLKAVSAVEFSEGEQVESILIGDSASWEVVKLKNGRVVSIKPIIGAATTNMTVYTDRRVYTFELHSLNELPQEGALPPIRSVFTYPPEPKPVSSVASSPERINASYVVSGRAEFRPLWVQDNGRQTSFFLPEGASRPAIFKVGPKKAEQLINSRTQGSRIVVDGVSDYWVLRIGDEVVCVGRKAAVKVNKRVLARKTGGKHAG